MHKLAVLLARAAETELHGSMGYKTLKAYARAEHDLRSRQVRDLVRLGRRVRNLPQLDHALSSGELEWTKARTMLSVLSPDNEGPWIDRALQSTVRELEDQTRGLQRGAPPPHPREVRGPALRRLVMDMQAHELKVVRDALAVVRAQSQDPDVSDGELLAMIVSSWLENRPDAPTRTPHQVVLELCPECERARGVDSEVTDTLVDEVLCNAEVVDMRPGPNRGAKSRSVPPRIQRIVLHRAGHACEVPGCCNHLWLHLHHLVAWSHGGAHSEENLVCLCSAHHRDVHEEHLTITRHDDGTLLFERPDGRILVKPP